ncbi:MAG: acyl-CoA thioesterase [Clostridiales bacterium]|nr:acyl-CoA thioesterase [Clostridiales bacterium]
METVYERKVNYYETDKMGVVHHANYIKYFEEARVYFLDKIGLSYKGFEETGIIMPVLSVEAAYKSSAEFDDILEVKTRLTRVTPVKAFFSYEITDKKTGRKVCTGSSAHGFLNRDFKPLNMKKEFPEIFKGLGESTDEAR